MSVGTLASLAILAAGGSVVAQVSEYYVLSGDQARFSVIQNGTVIRSWPIAPGTAQYQYPMVVLGAIRTMGAEAGAAGAEYSLTGADLGGRFFHPTGPIRSWDGATDGTSYYTIDTGGGVWRLDSNWQNPVRLFGAGGIGSLAYDAGAGTLWVSQFGTPEIRQYRMDGTTVSAFSTGHTQNMALAIDPADDTLWLHDRTFQGTFEQWTKSGTRLQRVAVAGMSGQNALSGEFQFGGGPCYADCDSSTDRKSVV